MTPSSESCHLHAPIHILPSTCFHSHSHLLVLPPSCSNPNNPIPTLPSQHSHPNTPIPTFLLALQSLCSHPHATIPTLPSQHDRFDVTLSMLPSQYTKPYDIHSLLFSEAGIKKYLKCEKNFKKIGRKMVSHKTILYSLTLLQ